MVRGSLSTNRVTVAAADLADSIGFDKVTISALARQFGVAVPSMYTHVRNLEDLRNHVSVLATSELADVISEAAAGRSGRAALTAFANAYRDFARAHPGRYEASQMQLPDHVLAASTGHQRVFRVVNQVFQAYGLSDEDQVDAVRLVRSTVHGFVLLDTQDGFGLPQSVGRSWQCALEALHTALAGWDAISEAATSLPLLPERIRNEHNDHRQGRPGHGGPGHAHIA